MPWDKYPSPDAVHRLIFVIYNSTLLPKLNFSSAKHSNPKSLFSLAVTLMCGEMAARNTHNSPAPRGKLSVPLVQMELVSQGALRPAGKARVCLDDWLNLGLISATRAHEQAVKIPLQPAD